MRKNVEATISVYAQFARRDTDTPNRWILGGVTLLQYDKSGAFTKESVIKRLTLDIS